MAVDVIVGLVSTLPLALFALLLWRANHRLRKDIEVLHEEYADFLSQTSRDLARYVSRITEAERHVSMLRTRKAQLESAVAFWQSRASRLSKLTEPEGQHLEPADSGVYDALQADLEVE